MATKVQTGEKQQQDWVAYLFLLPWLIGFLWFTLGPALASLLPELRAALEATVLDGLSTAEAARSVDEEWQHVADRTRTTGRRDTHPES